MNNCKFLIETNDGDFILEIPSFSNSASEYEFKASLYNYLSTVDIKEFMDSLKAIDKKLVIPENIKNTILGQDSLSSVSENFRDVTLKNKFRFLNKTLTDYWKDHLRKDNKRNSTKIQNIAFCAFDESIDYVYNSTNDVVFINTVNGINKNDILKASLERMAFLITGEKDTQQKLRNLDVDFLSKLGITATSTLTIDDVSKLYFNQNDLRKKSIEGFLSEKKESYVKIREQFEEKSSKENRDENYEPANAEFIYDLKPGDLVNVAVDKEISKNKKSSSGYYALLVDYFINSNGKYVMKVISPNSTYPETVELETPELTARKQSTSKKYEELQINNTGKYFPIKISKDLYFNNKFIYNFLKPGDKITVGTTDYTIINLKGSLFNVVDSKGEALILKPTNKIGTVKLSNIAHPELNLTSISSDFKNIPITKNSDKEFIQELDIVKYNDNQDGLVLYKVKNIFFVKNLSTGNIESITESSIREHYINNVGNKQLINNFNEEVKNIIGVDPFNYGDWLATDYNWLQYHEGLPIKRGDYLVIDNTPYLLMDVGNSLYRVYNGERYIFLDKTYLENALIVTKREQDPELSKISINKNSYYVSNKKEYSNSYEVKIIYNSHTGETRVVPINQATKIHYIDKTLEVKRQKGFKDTDTLYAFKNNNGIVIKNSEHSIPIYDADTKFETIFNDLIPGTFIKFSIDSGDLKYWMVEKRVKDNFVVSHSFIRDKKVITVKKLISASDKVSEVRLPSYATHLLAKINGTKSSLELTNEIELKEYDTPSILSNMIELMNKKFGITIKMVHTGEIENQPANAKAFVLNGEYFVNIDKASISDPLHEFLHIVLASMRATNFDQYLTLVQSIENHPLFEEVSAQYDEVNIDRLEETFIRLFSDTISNKIAHSGVFTEESFNTAVKEGVVEMLDLSRSLSDEYGLEIMNMKLKDILINFGSKIIEDSDSLYDKDKANTVIKASTIMRKLLKEGNLKEKCNG